MEILGDEVIPRELFGPLAGSLDRIHGNFKDEGLAALLAERPTYQTCWIFRRKLLASGCPSGFATTCS